MSPTAPIISKVWSFCTTLRDDGVGYGDYVEQLTYLIFLKMADEYAGPPHNRDVGIPKKYTWSSLKRKTGAELEVHYVELLLALGKKKGMLGQIFTKAQNKIDADLPLSAPFGQSFVCPNLFLTNWSRSSQARPADRHGGQHPMDGDGCRCERRYL